MVLAPGLGDHMHMHTHPTWPVELPPARVCGSHVPNLVLQEVHVPVEQGVGGREDAHRLHPGTALQLALHGHVGKAGQAEEGTLSKIAKKTTNRYWA